MAVRITLFLGEDWDGGVIDKRVIVDDLVRIVVCVRLLGLGTTTLERAEEDGFVVSVTPSSDKALLVLRKLLQPAVESPIRGETRETLLTVEEE